MSRKETGELSVSFYYYVTIANCMHLTHKHGDPCAQTEGEIHGE